MPVEILDKRTLLENFVKDFFFADQFTLLLRSIFSELKQGTRAYLNSLFDFQEGGLSKVQGVVRKKLVGSRQLEK